MVQKSLNSDQKTDSTMDLRKWNRSDETSSQENNNQYSRTLAYRDAVIKHLKVDIVDKKGKAILADRAKTTKHILEDMVET